MSTCWYAFFHSLMISLPLVKILWPNLTPQRISGHAVVIHLRRTCLVAFSHRHWLLPSKITLSSWSLWLSWYEGWKFLFFSRARLLWDYNWCRWAWKKAPTGLRYDGRGPLDCAHTWPESPSKSTPNFIDFRPSLSPDDSPLFLLGTATHTHTAGIFRNPRDLLIFPC